ncbi:NmrA family transcriptional regulator, partial [Streptomyces sp. NPDC058728]
AGEIALPTGDAVEAFVDADDIADVVVASLTDDKHIGKTYELSGPRLLSYTDVAAELSKATGRDIKYISVTNEEYRAVLRENDLPEEFADLFTMILDGRNAHLVHGVEEALGRKPKDFAEFARDAAAAGVWNV